MTFFRVYGFLVAFLFANTSVVMAADMGSIGSRVFKLQQNMAKRGNPLAQYKLGTFYEFGVSVKADLDTAKSWYQKAVVKKYRPAINRLKYLEIMAQGYKPEQYDDWLETIKLEAQRGKADSLILLGQMYHRGYGVKKNLKKALMYLQRASALGHPEIQNEIDKIESRLWPKKKPVEETAPVAVVKSKPVETNAKVTKPGGKTAEIEMPVKTEQAEVRRSSAEHKKEEKRRRYEAAMREYYRQQLILQQQQEWSESQLSEDNEADEESESL